MSIKIKYIIFSFIIFNFSNAQEKENLFLIFKEGSIDTCYYSPYRDGRNKKLAKYEQKFNYGLFVYGNQYFSFKKNKKIEEINSSEFNQIKISNIDAFFRKREIIENQLKNPNQLYKNIYLLIPSLNNTFFKIEVEWKEVYINSDDKCYEYID